MVELTIETCLNLPSGLADLREQPIIISYRRSIAADYDYFRVNK